MNKKRSIHINFSCVYVYVCMCVCVCIYMSNQIYEYIILTDGIKHMELFINLKT